MTDETRVVRGVDPRVTDAVAVAQRQRFRIDCCLVCFGPRVYSKVQPRARCLACGRITDLRVTQRAERRVKCETCGKFFVSRVAYLACPRCKALKAARQGIDAKWGPDVKSEQ